MYGHEVAPNLLHSLCLSHFFIIGRIMLYWCLRESLFAANPSCRNKECTVLSKAGVSFISVRMEWIVATQTDGNWRNQRLRFQAEKDRSRRWVAGNYIALLQTQQLCPTEGEQWTFDANILVKFRFSVRASARKCASWIKKCCIAVESGSQVQYYLTRSFGNGMLWKALSENGFF